MELIHEDNRIYALNDNGKIIAEITFPAEESGVVNFNHTFVDPSLRGKGIADNLMLAAVRDIQSKNLKALATCSYAVKWFAINPDYSAILKPLDKKN